MEPSQKVEKHVRRQILESTKHPGRDWSCRGADSNRRHMDFQSDKRHRSECCWVFFSSVQHPEYFQRLIKMSANYWIALRSNTT